MNRRRSIRATARPGSRGHRGALVVLALGTLLAACSRSASHEPGVTDEGPTASARPSASAPAAQPPPVEPPTAPPASPAKELLPPTHSHAVIAGVLSWPDPGLGAFSTRARKDQELAELLAKRGVPRGRIKLLLDEQATTSAILAAVTTTAQQAGKGTTLLVYYAGHGVRGKDGKAYFASRDMQTRLPAETGLSLEDLTEAIAGNFAGRRVVLMADCCYSGALKTVAEALAGKGVSAVSLTSADAANVSTKNWTFTQAIIDGLGGDVLCDEDGDGTITLRELSTEVRAAMLYREGQRYGYHRAAVPPETAVATVSGAGASKLPRNRRRYVEIQATKGWQVARVRAADQDRLTVRTYDYSVSTDHQVDRSRTRTIDFRRYPQGAAIEVYWGGKVWPAKVEKADGLFHFISYPGWPDYWNEWVTSRRIVDASAAGAGMAKGAPVMVEWRGDWWPATVLQRRGNRYLITYDGYDASWDEWVGPDRIRPR